MILAGDVGGTKTLLGVFDRDAARPRAVRVAEFGTLDYPDLGAMIDELAAKAAGRLPIDAACFGVAGPVIGDTAELTNVPWRVEARAIASRFGFGRVDLLNDLQAMAHGVTVLQASELHELQAGEPRQDGNIGLLAAGTGLGEALLHNVGGRFIPSPSEGGHADFAARNEREITLLRRLTGRFGRAQVEDVVSGPGLRNIHDVTHTARVAACPISRAGMRRPPSPQRRSSIAAMAVSRRSRCSSRRTAPKPATSRCAQCRPAGVFVGGGIAPKILPAMSDGRFIRAFREKAPFESLLAAMPVKVILNPETGLLGAAVFAAARRPSTAGPQQA